MRWRIRPKDLSTAAALVATVLAGCSNDPSACTPPTATSPTVPIGSTKPVTIVMMLNPETCLSTDPTDKASVPCSPPHMSAGINVDFGGVLWTVTEMPPQAEMMVALDSKNQLLQGTMTLESPAGATIEVEHPPLTFKAGPTKFGCA